MAGAVLTAAQQADLAKLSSDLLFLLQDAGVKSSLQAKLGELNIISVALFSGLDEDRAAVRTALAQDLSLDVAASTENRLEMARLLTAWEAARLQLQAVQRNQAESKMGVQQRILHPTEHQAMRRAVEAVLGPLQDKETPSKQVIAAKLEMIESNTPSVELLTEIASVEDAETETFEAKIDPVTNTLKIKSGKHSIAAPSTPEDLRLRHRRIGLAWDMLATKHFHRSWLSSNMTDCMRKFSDYILGNKVAGLVSGSRTPPWNLVLSFEHEVRRSVYRWIRDGEAATLQDAFKKAMADVELLNRHLVIPFSLNVSTPGPVFPPVPPALFERPPKGAGRGKGKSTGKTSTTQQAPKAGKLTKATDGTPICWKYNRRGGCHDAQCRFLHVCQRCQGKRPYFACKHVKRPAGAVINAPEAAN